MDAHQHLSLRQGQGLTSILLHHIGYKELVSSPPRTGSRGGLATRISKMNNKGMTTKLGNLGI